MSGFAIINGIRYGKTYERSCVNCEKDYLAHRPDQRFCGESCGTRYRRSTEARFKRLKSFGLTEESYDEMLQRQNGVCSICLKPETSVKTTGGIRRLAIDHDHKTGQVRGLLCQKCNRGLGMFLDDGELLLRAAKYLGLK